MTQPLRCPKCSALPVATDQSFRCLKCGWDGKRAQNRLNRVRRIYGVSVFLLFVVTLWAELSISPRFAAAILVFGWLVAIGGWECVSRAWNLSKVGQSIDPSKWDLWLRLPPPRIVRVREEAKYATARVLTVVTIFVGFSLLSALLLVQLRAYSPTRLRSLVLLGTVPCCASALVLVAFLAFSLKKSQRLVAHGEVTIGTVIGLRIGKRGIHTVTYEFKDDSGRLVSASCTDTAGLFAPGMSIPVFFNPENPAKEQVALCGSSYEVSP